MIALLEILGIDDEPVVAVVSDHGGVDHGQGRGVFGGGESNRAEIVQCLHSR